jgi:tRNA pseudouridine13 synthase
MTIIFIKNISMKTLPEEKKSLLLFKQKSQDFIVEEQLPFNLAGKGDAFFVFFEKRNKTTMEVIEHLCKTCNISRLTLGIAGLKDKTAITRQWVSIYKSALKKMG